MNKIIILSIAIALAIVGALYYFSAGVGLGDATPQSVCVNQCREVIAAGKNISDGPCLMNPIEEFPEWVCDVAHSPRDESDDRVENQCSEFARYHRAQYFVEVTPDCRLIGTGP